MNLELLKILRSKYTIDTNCYQKLDAAKSFWRNQKETFGIREGVSSGKFGGRLTTGRWHQYHRGQLYIFYVICEVVKTLT